MLFSSRLLVTKARKIAQQYYLRFKELIPVSELVQKVASVMQEYTQSGWENIHLVYMTPVQHSLHILNTLYSGVRPFGVSLLICGWDNDRPFLFQCDPSVSWWFSCNNNVWTGWVVLQTLHLLQVGHLNAFELHVLLISPT